MCAGQHQQAHAHTHTLRTHAGAPEPPAAPPVPIAVINAAETLLQKLHHSGKLLDVLVATGAECLWPSATLRLLRCMLLMHLEVTSAAMQPPRLRVFHVSLTAYAGAEQEEDPSRQGRDAAGEQNLHSSGAVVHSACSLWPL